MHDVTDFPLQACAATICHWDDSPGSGLTFQDLDRRAGRVAKALSAMASPGARILIGLPTSPEFLVAFFGCLYAGMLPAAIAPPGGKRRTERLQPLIDVTDPAAMIAAGGDGGPVQGLRCLDLAGLEAGDGYLRNRPGPDDIAYLQFTSGSTSLPRAVMIRHGAVLANLAAIRAASALRPGSVVASWLPMHHDMGLVSALFALRYGHGLTLERPEAFTRAPIRWLEAISRHRAGFSGAPNFAYDLLNRSRASVEAGALDLSCWQIAFCGAEPIRPAVLRRFAQRYAGDGLRPDALTPAYGMAEFTLLASCAGHGQSPAAREFEEGRRVMSCGTMAAGHDACVVDPDTRQPLPEGAQGEIWLHGPSMGAGYWRDPAATRATFEGRLPGDDRLWLRTGDLGCLQDGEVFVLGRLKDVLIVRGRNLHAEEVEAVVAAAHPILTAGVAAVSVDAVGGEGIGLVCELRKALPPGMAPGEVFEAVQRAVSDVFGIAAERIVLVRRGALPRTTSGKVRRADCRARLAEGDLPVLHDWQPRAHDPASVSASAGRDAEQVLDWIQRWLQVNLGLSVAAGVSLEKVGLDSLSALELAHDLEDWLRRPVSSTVVFEAATLSALAEALASEADAPDEAPDDAAADAPGSFDLDQRLSELENMSDSEVERLLSGQLSLRAVD